MKIYEGAEVYLNALAPLATGTHCIGGWVGARSGLNGTEKRK
jgi:hypothetical protein